MAVTAHTTAGRWVAHTPDGPRPLPGWSSYKVQIPRTGVGGFELVIPAAAAAASGLPADPSVSLSWETMQPDGAWFEPPNARYLPLRRTYAPDTGLLTIAGAGIGWLTGRAVRWYQPGEEDDDGKKRFTSQTAGQIIRWMYYWAMVRGALAGITIDWDHEHDSDGRPWTGRYTLAYERGVPWRQIIDGFAPDGLVWRFTGATMQLAQRGRFADQPTTAPVLYAGRDVSVDRAEITVEDSAAAVMALGSDAAVNYAMTAAAGPWGRWQIAMSESGTTDEVTLRRLAADELAHRGPSRASATVTLHPSARWRPFATIRPGQTVTVVTDPAGSDVWTWDRDRWDTPGRWGDGDPWWTRTTGRVEEITVTDDGTATTVALAVGEQTQSADDLLTRTVAGLTGGRITRGAITGIA